MRSPKMGRRKYALRGVANFFGIFLVDILLIAAMFFSLRGIFTSATFESEGFCTICLSVVAIAFVIINGIYFSRS